MVEVLTMLLEKQADSHYDDLDLLRQQDMRSILRGSDGVMGEFPSTTIGYGPWGIGQT